MNERLRRLYQEIDVLLNLAPCMDDCTEKDNEIYSDMANLKNSLFQAGYDTQKETIISKKAESIVNGVYPGDLVFCVKNEIYYGYRFLAVCNERVFVCPEDYDSEREYDFEAALEEMCSLTCAGCSLELSVFPAEKVFLSEYEAERYLQLNRGK